MQWTFAAEDVETPARARRAVRAFAAEQGADADTIAAIALCVSEAVSNAVVHAYRKLGRRGPVEVEARRPDGYLCIYVRDRGCGLRRRPDSPGLGLGMTLINATTSEVGIRPRTRGGTEVLMVFELSGSAVRDTV